MRQFLCGVVLLWAMPVAADWQDQQRVSNLIGYARAVAAACPSLHVSPAWVQGAVSSLSPDDQAALAGNPIYIEMAERHAGELLGQMADPCRVGRDFEAKLGEQVFEK